MARKIRPLTPEEAQWEATREERERWIYARLNRAWEETKAREQAAKEPAERKGRRRRRWRFFR